MRHRKNRLRSNLRRSPTNLAVRRASANPRLGVGGGIERGGWEARTKPIKKNPSPRQNRRIVLKYQNLEQISFLLGQWFYKARIIPRSGSWVSSPANDGGRRRVSARGGPQIGQWRPLIRGAAGPTIWPINDYQACWPIRPEKCKHYTTIQIVIATPQGGANLRLLFCYLANFGWLYSLFVCFQNGCFGWYGSIRLQFQYQYKYYYYKYKQGGSHQIDVFDRIDVLLQFCVFQIQKFQPPELMGPNFGF